MKLIKIDAVPRLSGLAFDAAARVLPNSWYGIRDNSLETFEGLKDAWEYRLAAGQPVPVSNRNCTGTLFGYFGNQAMRAYHDYFHLKLNLGFGLIPEVIVSLAQIYDLELHHDVSVSDLQLILADFIGQRIAYSIKDHFEDNQIDFDAKWAWAFYVPALVIKLLASLNREEPTHVNV